MVHVVKGAVNYPLAAEYTYVILRLYFAGKHIGKGNFYPKKLIPPKLDRQACAFDHLAIRHMCVFHVETSEQNCLDSLEQAT